LFAEPSRTANAYSEHGHYGLFYGTGGNLLGAQGELGILGSMPLFSQEFLTRSRRYRSCWNTLDHWMGHSHYDSLFLTSEYTSYLPCRYD
jgi:hypothetical protein